jgi:serine/threonine-protein kinase
MESTGDPRIGEAVGPYRIEAVLGVGGMGHVYRALGPDGEQVALKLVKRDLANDPTFRRRFDREARIARQVSHPHLVPVLDAGEHDGIPFLVQRFVGNGSLADRLERDGPRSLAETVGVCLQVGGALDELHASGMIHRDVKPANILLDESEVAYITDFGLAKDTQGSLLTRPGQALGSLDYMAPEQVRGAEVSAATDVYALGCVTFECVTGAAPFADRQGMRVLWAQLQDDPPDPREKQPELPEAAGAVILRALAKEAAERPQSAGEFANELKAAAGV